jgi:hydroxymethylpyrimidine pyrophosphatase-like HAD family hydrolase
MKILGSDYDGTLNYRLGQDTFDEVAAWRAAGHKFGIVSGRGVDFLQVIQEKYPDLELDFFVSFNGAAIVDGTGKLLYERRYDAVDPVELTQALLDIGCPFVHVNGDGYYCVVESLKKSPAWVDPSSVCFLKDLPPMKEFTQISIQLPDCSGSSRVVEYIRQIYGNTLNPLQNSGCVDIVAPDVNKAVGLRLIAQYFGADTEEIIAVGDNVNDADMIRAFRSYAMETGVESIKLMAGKTVECVAQLIRLEI